MPFLCLTSYLAQSALGSLMQRPFKNRVSAHSPWSRSESRFHQKHYLKWPRPVLAAGTNSSCGGNSIVKILLVDTFLMSQSVYHHTDNPGGETPYKAGSPTVIH